MNKDSNLPDKVEITDDKFSDDCMSKFDFVLLTDLLLFFYYSAFRYVKNRV